MSNFIKSHTIKLLVCSLIGLTAQGISTGALAEDDVEKYDDAWGESCNSDDSYAVKVINNSDRNLDVKVCLKRTNGSWSCFVSNNAEPGDVVPESWGYSVCSGTGESKWYWRDAGDYSSSFPSP